MTDDEVMRQTLAIAERRNIVGVLSGSRERVAAWIEADPRRFIPAVILQPCAADAPSPHMVMPPFADSAAQ
jgi:hypothetical protein